MECSRVSEQTFLNSVEISIQSFSLASAPLSNEKLPYLINISKTTKVHNTMYAKIAA